MKDKLFFSKINSLSGVLNIFLPLTPVLFFIIFFFRFFDFLPYEIFDWLNVFFDGKSVAFYFSPLFIYLFLTAIFVLVFLITISEIIIVNNQSSKKITYRDAFIASVNSFSIFISLYFIEIFIVTIIFALIILFPQILSKLNFEITDFIIKTLKTSHLAFAIFILIYAQFFMPIYLRTKKMYLSLKILLRKMKKSFYYSVNMIIYVMFIYSTIELISLLLGSKLKYYINHSSTYLLYKSQVSNMSSINEIFLSFVLFISVIVICLSIFVPFYNIIYIFGRKLIKKSLSAESKRR